MIGFDGVARTQRDTHRHRLMPGITYSVIPSTLGSFCTRITFAFGRRFHLFVLFYRHVQFGLLPSVRYELRKSAGFPTQPIRHLSNRTDTIRRGG